MSPNSVLPKPIIAGLAADLGLVAGEAIYGPAQAYLPLTGNHIGQIGFCLALSIIVCELKNLVSG